VLGPAERSQDRQDDLIFGLRLVERRAGRYTREDALDRAAKNQEIVFCFIPAGCFADAFAQEVAGE
jgi:hypothetical protein